MANYVLVRHKVEDFAKWKAAYDAERLRAAAGLSDEYLLQDADDPNMITLLFGAEDVERAKELFNDEALREIMQNAGVVGKPEIHFLKG